MTKRARISPRKSPRQTRSTATVSAILDAAARILARDGFERTNVNHVATLAGVSVGSLYQYFPSKDALVLAVMKRHSERMIEVFRRDIADLVLLPVPDAVRGIVQRALEAYAVDPALVRVMAADEPKLGALARSAEFDEMLRELLTAYVTFHAAEFRATNASLAIRIAQTAVEAVIDELIIEDPTAAQLGEIAEELTALLLGYLGKPGLREA